MKPKPMFLKLNTAVYRSPLPPAVPQVGQSDEVELSLVLEGKGHHRLLNETLDCRRGDLYLLNGAVPHFYYAQEGETLVVQTLRFQSAEPSCCGIFADGVPVAYALLNAKAFEQVTDMLAGIQSEAEGRDSCWETAAQSYLSLLLIAVCRYINMADTAGVLHPKEWVSVSAALREVEEQYGDAGMTLDSVAAALYISSPQLSRLFPKVLGRGFQEYVRNLRVSRACELLRNTPLTNEEIVTRCGLKDVPSFYRVFKSVMGTTPYQYRMSYHNDEKGEKNMNLIEISESLQKGRAKLVEEGVKAALEEGIPAARILNEGLMDGMNVVGEKFKRNEVYVPEVLVAARAMNKGIAVLKPYLAEDGVEAKGRVCIGTVQGDLHDIGKNLVKMMMEGKGLEVIDLGTDVSAETFVQTAVEQNCQVICCSALLSTTMDVMAEVVKLAEEKGIRDRVKIMVGGAPVSEEYCQKINADCYTVDAASAADAAVELCQ